MIRPKSKTTSNIVFHRTQSTTSREEEELIQKSVRALTTATDPLEKLRLLCLSHGASGIVGLSRVFRMMDNDGRKRLSKNQFLQGIRDTELELSDEDAEEVFNRFDRDNTGSIDLDEFLLKLQPPLPDCRRALVEKVFKKLDKTGEGAISIAEVRAVYSATAYPRYMSGEVSADTILKGFLANFETEGTDDGKITLEDFMNYYSGISTAMESDCYFDLLMRQTYKL